MKALGKGDWFWGGYIVPGWVHTIHGRPACVDER